MIRGKLRTPGGYETFLPDWVLSGEPYLPTEAGEDNLSVAIFVLQLFGDSDEGRAGLRAVPRLQGENRPGCSKHLINPDQGTFPSA